jgi:tetratricopeptide (TPR) repeat protein
MTPPVAAEPGASGSVLSLRDRIVVFTGRLRSLSHFEAAELVRRAGGVVRTTVTRDISFLITGEAEPHAAARSTKLREVARLIAEGAYIRVLAEAEFLRLAGIELAANLDERYYTAADIRALYDLDGKVLRRLERLRLLRPVLRTNADRYYTFQDLLVLKQVQEGRANGAALARTVRHLRLERRGQIRLCFDGGGPRVIEFRKPEQDNWTAEEWYELGCDCDEDPDDFSRATLAYEHALELDPHHVGALVNLGNVYYRLEQIDDARRLYERALAIDPQNPNVHYNLGNVYDDLEEFRTAIRFFQAALRLNPANADAHFNMGLVHDRLGDVDKVRQHMLSYIRLEPDGEMAEIAREYLSLTGCEDGAKV